jgi:hypothetical protein
MEQQPVEIMKPQKTWFFTDSTGRIFSTNEQEAFALLTNTNRWRRQDIKMVGMSDGSTYFKTIAEAKGKGEAVAKQLEEKRETLNKYIKGHDNLLFNEFAEKDDPRVLRAQKLIKDLEEEMKPLEDEMKKLKSNIVQTAFDAELEKARGNIVMPRDFSVIGKTDGSPRNQKFMENFAQSKAVI